ncbi:hypothetical protein pdam_00020776, partial [Pocillopora damicornis]
SSSVDDIVISSNTAIEGLSYNLSCEVSGDPVPSVSWIKVSNDEHRVGKILNFTRISRNDAGSYTCEAIKPEIKQFTTSATSHTVCQNDVISFNCSAEANPLVTSYQLFENDTAILGSSGMWSRNMSTRGVFIYKCVANNTYGTGNRENIAVRVYVKPEIKQFKTSAANYTACQDDVISLNCSANANPLVTSYQLFENDTAILDTDNSGMWSRNMSTRGVFIYKCMASNTYGTGNSEKIAVHVY